MLSKKKEAYAYINEYQKEKYDRITILRKNGEKEQLTKLAKDKGYRTLTEFINSCIDERLNKYILAEQPTQAPESPAEPHKSASRDYLPLTPENIAKVDLGALLTGGAKYQMDVLYLYGPDGFNKLVEMAEEKKSRG